MSWQPYYRQRTMLTKRSWLKNSWQNHLSTKSGAGVVLIKWTVCLSIQLLLLVTSLSWQVYAWFTVGAHCHSLGEYYGTLLLERTQELCGSASTVLTVFNWETAIDIFFTCRITEDRAPTKTIELHYFWFYIQ